MRGAGEASRVGRWALSKILQYKQYRLKRVDTSWPRSWSWILNHVAIHVLCKKTRRKSIIFEKNSPAAPESRILALRSARLVERAARAYCVHLAKNISHGRTPTELTNSIIGVPLHRPGHPLSPNNPTKPNVRKTPTEVVEKQLSLLGRRLRARASPRRAPDPSTVLSYTRASRLARLAAAERAPIPLGARDECAPALPRDRAPPSPLTRAPSVASRARRTPQTTT